MITATDDLEDVPFYNERSVAGDYPNACMLKVFAPGARIWGFVNGTCDQPTYTAYVPNTTVILGKNVSKEDIYMQNSVKGNGLLKYPVGLITSDEAALAGGIGWNSVSDPNSYKNVDFYLYSATEYWTMSPNYMDRWIETREITIGANGGINWSVITFLRGIRPVISLKPGTIYYDGNGTKENPFLILEKE